jgi:hypothetical protein
MREPRRPRALVGDEAGGTDALELLILIALVAFAGLGGAFWFGNATRGQMEAQAARVVTLAPGAARHGAYDDGVLPEPPEAMGSLMAAPLTWSSGGDELPRGRGAALGASGGGLLNWVTGRILGRDTTPEWEHAGSTHVVYPDGRVERDVPLVEIQRRVRAGELGAGAVNGSLHSRATAQADMGARARQTGQAQVLIYYPQGVNFFNGDAHRAEVRRTIAAVRDAAGDEPFSWTCHSHACHFVADELRDATGQTLDAYAPAHNPFEQRRMWIEAVRTTQMDRVTIYRGSDDALVRIGGGGYSSGGDPCLGPTCGTWNGDVRDAVEGNPRVSQVVLDARHNFRRLLEQQCATQEAGALACP